MHVPVPTLENPPLLNDTAVLSETVITGSVPRKEKSEGISIVGIS